MNSSESNLYKLHFAYFFKKTSRVQVWGGFGYGYYCTRLVPIPIPVFTIPAPYPFFFRILIPIPAKNGAGLGRVFRVRVRLPSLSFVKLNIIAKRFCTNCVISSNICLLLLGHITYACTEYFPLCQ